MRIYTYAQFKDLVGEEFIPKKFELIRNSFHIGVEYSMIRGDNFQGYCEVYCDNYGIDKENLTILYRDENWRTNEINNAYPTVFIRNKNFLEIYKKFDKIKAFL